MIRTFIASIRKILYTIIRFTLLSEAAQRFRAERPGQDSFMFSRQVGRVSSSEWLGGEPGQSEEHHLDRAGQAGQVPGLGP